MLAQLDMPCMVFTLLAVLFFSSNRNTRGPLRPAWFSVLMKETGIVTPFVFFCFLARQKDWKRASWFAAPVVALLLWLTLLHAKTGYWLGDAEFARYNVSYALKPARILISLLRRIFYLFFAESRFVGTFVLIATVKACKTFHTRAWAVVAAVVGFNIVLVSVLGGAEFERYLLPVAAAVLHCRSLALTECANRSPLWPRR